MNQKKKKQLIILIVALIALTGIFLFLKRIPEEEEATSEEEQYSVMAINEELVTEIGITTKAGTIDLYKEGDTWKFAADETVEIDTTKVENFLRKMCSIESDTKIEDVSSLSDYGLEDPVMQVTLQWDNNLYTIKGGDYNSVINSYYISLNEETTVYTTDSTVYNAMNKEIADFETEEVQDSDSE